MLTASTSMFCPTISSKSFNARAPSPARAHAPMATLNDITLGSCPISRISSNNFNASSGFSALTFATMAAL